MDVLLTLTCPHCLDPLQVAVGEINCGIFRHAVLRATMTQVNPHAPKSVCDTLAATGSIYGCGQPFAVRRTSDGGFVTEKCEYV